jgi:hypothetical protein
MVGLRQDRPGDEFLSFRSDIQDAILVDVIHEPQKTVAV